jgi:hypothetical protein
MLEGAEGEVRETWAWKAAGRIMPMTEMDMREQEIPAEVELNF